MQLVIEISDTLKDIADNEDAKTFSHIVWQALLMVAIKNGTPFPKGHGDLIDRSKLVPDCYELEIHDGDDWRNEYCGVSLTQIEEDAEVIVKADGGDTE